MTVRGYTLAVDWSQDGTYTGTLEDITTGARLAEDPTLHVAYGRDTAQALSPMAAGKLTFGINNEDRAFSPENTASAIAGDVEPGRAVRLQYSGTTLFEGVVEDIEVDHTDPGRKVTVECLDAWGRPGAEKLSTPVHTGVRTGDAINLILDAIGWPTAARDIDPGATVINWWWAEGDDAATAVEKLVNSEGPPAGAWVEGGTFVYRDRHHRILNTASLTSQASFSHANPAGSRPGTLKILGGAEYDRGMANIINTVTFPVEVRRHAATGVVWSTDDTFSMTDGETIEIEAQADDPFLNAIVPVDGTDFTTSPGAVEVWLSRDSGQAVTIFVKAVGGPATIVGMALRAQALTVARTTKVHVEDSVSRGKFGVRTWEREAPWCGVEDARAVAQRIVAVYAEARPTVTVQVAITPTGSHPVIGKVAYTSQITGRRISDRVTIAIDELGLDEDFFVEHIEHDVKKLGALHVLTLGCQVARPEQPANVFTFDVAGLGFNDGVFGLSGIDDPDSVFVFDGGSGHRFDEGAFAV